MDAGRRETIVRTRWSSFAAAALAATVFTVLPLAAQTRPIPLLNSGFEQGEPGAPPPDWGGTLVAEAPAPGRSLSGYRAVIDAEERRSGRASVRLERAAEVQGQPFGTVTTSVDATPWRGRRVRLTAAVRTDAPAAQHAGLWLRVDRAEGRRGFFDNMADRPIRGAEWREYAVEGDVAPDAERIFLGALLVGDGRLWLDDVRLEDVGPAAAPAAGAAVFDAPEYLDSALALLRRHHINRASADWDRLTADARAAIAGALGPADVHEAIRGVVAALGERHTFLRPRPDPADARTMRPPVEMPTWNLVEGRFGMVRLPGFLGSEAESRRYAATLREGLTLMDRRGVCGWIVDLRGDTGGNMWPMLGGLDPLLGAAPFGSFRNSDGVQNFWIRGPGEIRTGAAATPRAPAFRLRNADAPVAVLLGPRTSSSGEMTAIAFVGRPGARSFGAPTAGFSTANSPFPLPDGAWLVITTAFVRDRTGHEYRGPVNPDEVTGADSALASALRWLSSQPCG